MTLGKRPRGRLLGSEGDGRYFNVYGCKYRAHIAEDSSHTLHGRSRLISPVLFWQI